MKSTGKIALEVGIAAALCVVFAGAVDAQKKKNKNQLSDVVVNAQYVYVEAYDGPEWDRSLTPEDRKAIADVERAVQSWGRYRLALRRADAEIVLQVRKGRIASARAGGGVSVDRIPTHVEFPPRTTTQTTTHGDTGLETGPAEDLLWVYLTDGDSELSAPLWRGSQSDGLRAPELKLFQRFKDEVNEAAAAQAKRKAASGATNPGNSGGPGSGPGAAPNPSPTPNPNPGAAPPPKPNPAPNPPGAN